MENIENVHNVQNIENVEKETVRDLQRQFDLAELAADAERLRDLLTDDFRSIGPKGYVLDKEQWIGRHAQFQYHSLDTSELDIRMYGDAAIVRNVQSNKATSHGRPVALRVRVSQTWVKQQGSWRLAGIQFSSMADDA
jgi:ketosteroid isomerase-like protein